MGLREKIAGALIPHYQELQELRHFLVPEHSIMVAPATAETATNQVRGNRFVSYGQQVLEINKRYNARALYGNSGVRTCVNYRTSWIAGNGATFSSDDEKTQDWLTYWSDENKLDGKGIISLVRAAELEGKVLLVPRYNEETVLLRYLPWLLHRYEVTASPEDYCQFTSVIFPQEKDRTKQKLAEGDFVYIKLGGTDDSVNATPPCIASVLTNIDNMDRALADIRANHHYYGGGITPYFETQDWADAKALKAAVTGDGNKWVPGKLLAGRAKHYLVEPSGQATDAIAKEIAINIRIISAETGIPVHFLGYVDLFGTKAGAQEMQEMILAGTYQERETIKAGLEDAAKMCIRLWNESTGENISEEDVQCTLPPITEAQVQSLINLYLPAFNAGLLSKQSIIERIPGIDPEVERERMEAEKEEAAGNRPDSGTMPDEMLESFRSALKHPDGR